ncbi:Asp-tRNA(Asn)/Glu-tRNA(Gln) amidotransferase subunit GatC [Robiginitomaculum antarcticum]|uniref:Asp-tRNA(Asn)/Glu-tRNA(Gln) amidotransferase subunit GatC n=1 Tax=Robiginitomaculum antarcticum TaxID=437507 RepID=UPI000367D6C3|nr:Asp-tRNA(Asn)/Glu-tRNA(Gln) amidotransferase subunit GatC [Robiginitomaculum antarcticum]
MSVSAKDVKKIARLSRLHVEDNQLEPLAGELNGILKWIEQLGEVDVEGVEPMTSAVDMDAPLRKDEITDGGVRDKILANAPKSDDGFFVVPRSVE